MFLTGWRRGAAAAAVAAAIAVPAAVLAGFTSGGPLNTQAHFPASTGSTQSREWRNVPALGNLMVSLNAAPIGATVNLTTRGGPFRLRVLIDGAPMAPGAARLQSVRGSRSMSFTFVAPGVNDVVEFDVQWRARQGDRVTLQAGSLNLLYFFI